MWFIITANTILDLFLIIYWEQPVKFIIFTDFRNHLTDIARRDFFLRKTCTEVDDMCLKDDIIMYRATTPPATENGVKMDNIRRRLHTLPKAFAKLKSELNNVRSRIHSARVKLGSSSNDEGSETLRTYTVEYPTDKKKKSSRKTEDVCEMHLDNRNYTPSLLIHPIFNGKFRADISLSTFPPGDDIVVRVRNYKLDICVQKRREDKKETEVLPSCCGQIDLPIYIDPTSLRFSVEDEDILTIEGLTKSLLTNHHLSTSNDMLQNKSFSGKFPIPRRKRTSSSSSGSCDDMYLCNDIFRSRAYTR